MHSNLFWSKYVAFTTISMQVYIQHPDLASGYSKCSLTSVLTIKQHFQKQPKALALGE